MKKLLLLAIFALVFAFTGNSQSVTNGTFAASGASWGCSPEANNFETTYGGSVATNRVAEIDAAAGLCQTIAGFTIGSLYDLSFDCTRRTGGCPSPNPTPMLVTVTGGGTALSTTVSRSNGTFGFTTTVLSFTALGTSQTITFSPGAGFGAGTCGMIVDNVIISLNSPLPVELLSFKAIANTDKVDVSWTTASELNNDYYTVEKSKDAINFEPVMTVKGAGNSTSVIDYFDVDRNPYFGISYYRLKQTDFNGLNSYSNVVPVEYNPNGMPTISVFPNPQDAGSVSYFSLNQFEGQEVLVVLRDIAGRELFSKVVISTANEEIVSLNQDGKLAKGSYLIMASSANKLYYKHLIVK